MKIKTMRARFGALDGSLSLSDGLNILTAPNERGKSTWCAFLRVMLYGVSTSQRAKQGQKPDKTKYRPWSGASMEGSIDLATPAGDVTIRRRTERDDRPMQAFSAVYSGTENPVSGLTGTDAGETLTGMPPALFERSVFIRQAGMAVTDDPELERRIRAIVSAGDEETSFSEAEARLKTWQRHRKSGTRGAIPTLTAAMEDTRRTLDAMASDRRNAAGAEEEITALEARCAGTETAIAEARARQRKQSLADLGAVRREVQAAEEDRAEAAAAFDRAKRNLDANPFGPMGPEEASSRSAEDQHAAEELRRLAEKLPPVKLAYIPLALAALAFLLAVITPWKLLCAGVGCVFVLLFVVMYTRLHGLQKTKAVTLADRDRILTAYGVKEPEEIDGLLTEYLALWRERERAKLCLEEAEAALEQKKARQRTAEEQAMGALDFAAGNNEAARLSRELDALRRRLQEARERRAMAEGRARALGDPVALESELLENQRRLGELTRQEDALELALDTLADADAELQQRLSPVLARRAAEYFSELTDGRYDEITLARDLTANARRTGDDMGRELDYLSAGAKDQLYLALRLAVCDLALPEGDPCPLVLDDALTAFDTERMEAALRLLKRLSRKRQILLFTCHDREAAFFAGDPEVRVIDLRNGGKDHE